MIWAFLKTKILIRQWGNYGGRICLIELNFEEVQLDVLVANDELDVNLQHELQARASYRESKVTSKVNK